MLLITHWSLFRSAVWSVFGLHSQRSSACTSFFLSDGCLSKICFRTSSNLGCKKWALGLAIFQYDPNHSDFLEFQHGSINLRKDPFCPFGTLIVTNWQIVLLDWFLISFVFWLKKQLFPQVFSATAKSAVWWELVAVVPTVHGSIFQPGPSMMVSKERYIEII